MGAVLFACICALAATIHKICNRNCFASTERPQIIVGMSAPTSGICGDGEEIGAALSRGRERPRYYDYPHVLHHQQFATARGIRSCLGPTPQARVSAIGTNRTWASAPHMSAFGGNADMAWCTAHVRLWPKADIENGATYSMAAADFLFWGRRLRALLIWAGVFPRTS